MELHKGTKPEEIFNGGELKATSTLERVAITVGFAMFVFVASWRFNRVFAQIRQEEEQLHPEILRDQPNVGPMYAMHWEYRSRATLFGLPLVHCRGGKRPGEKMKPAVGWIAFGEIAYGILFACGGVAVGGISMGGIGFGIVSIGGFGIGLFAFGGLVLGAVAMGGAAIGLVASGGIAIAWHAAIGGMAAAHELACGGSALANHANDDVAREFFRRYRWLDFTQPGPGALFWTLCFGPMIFQILTWTWWRRKMAKHVKLNS